jgi:predicted Fe-Mo cluster-binding NifX family protein
LCAYAQKKINFIDYTTLEGIAMKLCITAAGNSLEARTEPSFGRAPWFLLVDTETLAFEAVQNSGVNATQGAGIAAAQTIRNGGAQGVLTGRVGPKALAALQAAGIPIYEGLADCSVRQALVQFNQGGYRPSGAESVGPSGGDQAGTRGESAGQCRAQGGQGRGLGGRGRGCGRGMGGRKGGR